MEVAIVVAVLIAIFIGYAWLIEKRKNVKLLDEKELQEYEIEDLKHKIRILNKEIANKCECTDAAVKKTVTKKRTRKPRTTKPKETK